MGRTWGWLPTAEEAAEAVLTNLSDMFEQGWYRYAVVEEVPPGLCPLNRVVSWYEATYVPGSNTPTVTRLEAAPEGLADICAFSVG